MSDILYRAVPVSMWVSFAGHQGSSQSDPRTNTGFGSFKLPTCGWLQKGRSHSHMYMESSLVWWLGHVTCGLGTCRLTTCNLTYAFEVYS